MITKIPPASDVVREGRHVRAGHGDPVHWSFWVAAISLTVALLLRLPPTGGLGLSLSTLIVVAGGLPHGAYDIALLARTAQLRDHTLPLAVSAYVLVAVAMTALWMTIPLAALILFLLVATIHFGEDWTMLDEPLLKVAAGAAILTAAAIGHPDAVSAIFIEMVGSYGGATVAHTLLAAAPLTLLVTAVGIMIAWREGQRCWAAAIVVSLVLLLAAPPVAGFALFFVFLHSPRHLAVSRETLAGIPRLRWTLTGTAMSLLAVVGWAALGRIGSAYLTTNLTGQGFELLAAVATPHLLLTDLIRRGTAAREFRLPITTLGVLAG